MLRDILSGMAAGLLVSLGGAVFLSCDSKYIGALMFCVGLTFICMRGYALFTGKVGYIPGSHTKADVQLLFACLLGNLIGCVITAYALRCATPSVADNALALCTAKLTQTAAQTFIRAIFCGMLVYLAVAVYRDKGSVIGVLLGIPAFILSSFEHSIADMFYFAASGIVSLEAFGFIWIVLFGNALGSILLFITEREIKKEKVNA